MLPAPPSADVDHLVKPDGDPLPSDLQAIDTRGHTPGHWSYLLEREGGVLFVGDAGAVAKSGEVSRGWFNRSTAEIDASLQRLAERQFDKAVFGHAKAIRSEASIALRRFALNLPRGLSRPMLSVVTAAATSADGSACLPKSPGAQRKP